MSVGWPGAATTGELERVRREYESSLSWRLSRPVRAVGALGRALRSRPAVDGAVAQPAEVVLDPWLHYAHGERLAAIDAACARATPDDQPSLFGGLDDALWALLLT